MHVVTIYDEGWDDKLMFFYGPYIQWYIMYNY